MGESNEMSSRNVRTEAGGSKMITTLPSDPEATSPLRILRFAGAFSAWVIGSGFATGQEILQFVTSYGYQSYLVLLVLLIGFAVMGFTITGVAFAHRPGDEVSDASGGFRHFNYFCGKKLGTAYYWIVPCVQVIPFSILLSGAGATLPHTTASRTAVVFLFFRFRAKKELGRLTRIRSHDIL
jgi:hypothetical protein